MALLSRSDLRYSYPPGTTKGDDPKLRGEPDSSLFSRHEAHEVLYLINSFASKKHWVSKSNGLKVERLIHEYLPPGLHSQANVLAWLGKNVV